MFLVFIMHFDSANPFICRRIQIFDCKVLTFHIHQNDLTNLFSKKTLSTTQLLYTEGSEIHNPPKPSFTF